MGDLVYRYEEKIFKKNILYANENNCNNDMNLKLRIWFRNIFYKKKSEIYQ